MLFAFRRLIECFGRNNHSIRYLVKAMALWRNHTLFALVSSPAIYSLAGKGSSLESNSIAARGQ
jgi:hypothetical protein